MLRHWGFHQFSSFWRNSDFILIWLPWFTNWCTVPAILGSPFTVILGIPFAFLLWWSFFFLHPMSCFPLVYLLILKQSFPIMFWEKMCKVELWSWKWFPFRIFMVLFHCLLISSTVVEMSKAVLISDPFNVTCFLFCCYSLEV